MTYSEQLERETETCRVQLADTLDELRMRMTPGEVVDQLVDYARDTTGGMFVENLKQQVASNPLPVALMGAGLAWLMCGKAVNALRMPQGAASFAQRRRGWMSESAQAAAAAKQDAARRLNEAASAAREAAGEAVGAGRERMRAEAAAVSEAASEASSHLSDAVGDASARTREAMAEAAARTRDASARLGEAASAAGAALGDTVSETYGRAATGAGRAASTIAGSASRIGSSAAASGRELMDFCRDQPLVLAGLGLALGAAIGAALPRTRTEDRIMGDVSDEFRRQTSEFAGEQLDKAQAVAERAYETARQEAQHQGLSSKTVADEAASRIENTGIAHSSEADEHSNQASGEKPEPRHERH